MKSEKIISACISICKTDYSTGYCYGCAIPEKEKIMWKHEETSNKWKKENITELLGRMNGWQLDAFKESYDHKVKTGISIFKKNQIKK